MTTMASILGRAVLLKASVPVPQFLTHTAGSVVMKMVGQATPAPQPTVSKDCTRHTHPPGTARAHVTQSNAARVLAAPVLQVGHFCICEDEMHDRVDADGTSTANSVDLAALEAFQISQQSPQARMNM